MNKKIKILVGALIIIIIVVGGWLILKSEKIEKRVEIKGKLEMVEGAPVFNKECLNNDLKVESFYLKGVCEKPYLAASLSGIIGEEIGVKGEAKKVAGIKVIEVEEIMPPEIIRIITNTTVYEMGEKITVHLKHYLKKSVFVYFNTEKPICSIKSIEKKNSDWEELPTWFQPPDCNQIILKEIKPYHLSGEFSIFEWQPNLESGEYKLKIVYKLEGEEDWKEVYSNEFAILGLEISKPKPIIETKCEVNRGYQDYRDSRQKAAILEIGFNNYTNFFLKKTTIQYDRIVRDGSLLHPQTWEYIDQGFRPFMLKLKAKDGRLLSTYELDPGERIVYCEIGGCPPPLPSEFIKESEFSLWIPLPPFLPGKGVGEIKSIRSIEISEREKLPDWAVEERKTLPGYKPNELLLKIDLSECLEKFCGEMAYQDDPYCVEEYPIAPVIKGKVTDYQGNPVEKVYIIYTWAPFEKPIAQPKFGDFYTDKNGNYIFDTIYKGYPEERGLKEGIYSLSFQPLSKLNLKPEYVREITLRKDDVKTLDITLKQCGSILGKVTDSFGNPITETPGYKQGGGYEIGFETPRYGILDEKYAKEFGREAGTFIIPYLEPREYTIGAYVIIGEKTIVLLPKKVKVELGKTAIVNFVLEK